MSTYKAIVTGGYGFIGINLIHQLVKKHEGLDISIIVIDNFSSSNTNYEFPLQILRLIKVINISTSDIDIDDMVYKGVQEVYHLACIASPRLYMKNTLSVLDSCFNGTKKVLELTKKYNAKMFYASSSEIYGDSKISPQNEEYFGNVNPFCSRSCYMEGKRIGEALCYEYIDKYFLDIKIGRIFNTYGPYMDENDGRVISNFLTQVISGNNLTIHGDGIQTRSFMYIDDLLEGISLIMRSTYNAPVNLGNPIEFSIKELAEKVLGKFPSISNSKIIFLETVVDEPKRRIPDVSKMYEITGWSPKIQLNEGLRMTYNYFSDNA